MGVSTKSTIYAILLLASVLVAIDIWYVTNILQAREIGFLIWEGGLAILFFLLSAVLSFSYMGNGKARTGILMVLGLFIMDILIMLNYSTMIEFTDRLSYYFHLSLTASAFILAGMIGNVVRIEKKNDEGFAVHLHSEDSPISPRMIIPTWLAVFLAMGGFVMISGTVLVQYPSFGALPWLGGPSTSGFGVGDWENIVFMIFPFALTFGVASYKKLVPKDVAFILGLITGTSTFGAYHSLVYSTNTVAMIIVLIFGALSIASYYYTRSVVIMSALHIGNNFWGALFSANVIGFSVFGITSPLSNVIFSVVTMIVAVGAVLFIVKRYGRKGRSHGK